MKKIFSLSIILLATFMLISSNVNADLLRVEPPRNIDDGRWEHANVDDEVNIDENTENIEINNQEPDEKSIPDMLNEDSETKLDEITSQDPINAHTKGIQISRSPSGKDFLISWLLTIIIETWVLFLFYIFNKKSGNTNEWWNEWEKIWAWKILFTGIFASTLTLPLLRYVFPMFLWYGNFYIGAWETLVFIIEAVLIKYFLNIRWSQAFLISFVCNITSLLIGVILSYLILIM